MHLRIKEVYVMNLTKFTQKSIQAVEGCEKLAYEYGNQEIEEEHLLYSLLTIDDSLILKLIEIIFYLIVRRNKGLFSCKDAIFFLNLQS